MKQVICVFVASFIFGFFLIIEEVEGRGTKRLQRRLRRAEAHRYVTAFVKSATDVLSALIAIPNFL